MWPIRVVITGLDELAWKLREMPLAVQRRAHVETRDQASNMQMMAQTFAPKDTLELAHSIESEIVSTWGRETGIVSTDKPYAINQEFGTAENDPHPFLRPAAQIGARSRNASVAKSLISEIRGFCE